MRHYKLLTLLLFLWKGKCSDEWHSLFPPVLSFMAKIHHSTHIVVNHPHSFHIPLFPLSSSLPTNHCLVELAPKRMLPDHYSLNQDYGLLLSSTNMRISCTSYYITLYLCTWWTKKLYMRLIPSIKSYLSKEVPSLNEMHYKVFPFCHSFTYFLATKREGSITYLI